MFHKFAVLYVLKKQFMMNVVLIEFNSHHDECIYSQVAFLKSLPKVKLHLICNYRLKDRIAYLDEFDDTLFVRSNQWGIGHLRILEFLNRNNINKVIFNSVPNESVNNLLRICSKRKRDYFGIVHNREQLKNVKYARTYNMINSFYVLNDYLLENIEHYTSVNATFESYYPIFFPKHNDVELTKGEDEIWITIPGKMELKRRDYLQLLESFKAGSLNKNIKLLFLGQSDQDIRREFETYNSNNNCMFWDGYIGYDAFHSYLQKSDYILPLIHGDHTSSRTYRNKISGSFNLAISYHIPMIMDSFFYEIEDFKTTALFYTAEDDLIEVLNKVTKPMQKLNNDKWTFELQRDKFVAFLQ